MVDRTVARARARRQERVAKVVWGTLFVVMGVLFTLHDMGLINLGERTREFAAERAVDGDGRTRWASAFREGEWLAVDLGAAASLGRIRINWEAAYAKEYELQLSTDGAHWTTAQCITDAQGGIDEQEVGATARYVRLLGNKRATPYGYSVWELEVFDSTGALVSQGKRAIASSEENHAPFALWLRFWPLLLVASGLPLLLAPRDDTSQVMGMALTAVGAFLQLQRVLLVPWGLRETASVILILVGAVILIQSLRRNDSAEDGGTGAAGDGT